MNRNEYDANYAASYRQGRTPAQRGISEAASSRNDYDIDSMIPPRSLSRDPSQWNRRTESYDRRASHMSTPGPPPAATSHYPPSRAYDFTPSRNEYEMSEPSMKREYSPARISDNKRANGTFKGFTSIFPSNNDEPAYQNEDVALSRRRPYPPDSDQLTSVSMKNYPSSITNHDDSRYRPRSHREPYNDDYQPDSSRNVIDNKNKFETSVANGEQQYLPTDAASVTSQMRPSLYGGRQWEANPGFDNFPEDIITPQITEHTLSPRSFKRECQRAYKEARAQRMRNLEEGLYSKCDWAKYDKYC